MACNDIYSAGVEEISERFVQFFWWCRVRDSFPGIHVKIIDGRTISRKFLILPNRVLLIGLYVKIYS